MGAIGGGSAGGGLAAGLAHIGPTAAVSGQMLNDYLGTLKRALA